MLTVNSITLGWLFNPFLLCLWLPDRARWCKRKIKPLLIMWDISVVAHLHSAPTPMHIFKQSLKTLSLWLERNTIDSTAYLLFKLFCRYWMFDSALRLASRSDGYGMGSYCGRAFSPSMKSSAKSIDLCWTRTLCLHICLSLVLSHSR